MKDYARLPLQHYILDQFPFFSSEKKGGLKVGEDQFVSLVGGSVTVVVLVFCLALLCLMARPSAKRTILLTTPLLDTAMSSEGRTPSGENEENREKKAVNPVYWWLVQPQKETGLKEGRFSLSRNSQKKFPFDRENLRRSSSLNTESSGNLSRASSISMSTIISNLSRTDSEVSRDSQASSFLYGLWRHSGNN